MPLLPPVHRVSFKMRITLAMATAFIGFVGILAFLTLRHFENKFKGSLNLRTIAEGVENEGMLHQLPAFQCDGVQGYHFARPMPAERIDRLLRTMQAE